MPITSKERHNEKTRRWTAQDEKVAPCARAIEPKPIKHHQWEKIAQMLKVGGSLKDAAALARISEKRLFRNLEADVHMRKDIAEIMAGCKLHHLQKIYDGIRGWQASAWFLERIYRKEFCLLDISGGEEEKAIQIRKVVRQSGIRPGDKPSEN